MDMTQVERLLAQQDFPKFSIDVDRDAFGGNLWFGRGVKHTIRTVNSYRPDEGEMTLYMNSSMPEFVKTDEDFHDWCLANLIWFAEHETREWFRVDGKMWLDPHDPAMPQRFDIDEQFYRVKSMRPTKPNDA